MLLVLVVAFIGMANMEFAETKEENAESRFGNDYSNLVGL